MIVYSPRALASLIAGSSSALFVRSLEKSSLMYTDIFFRNVLALERISCLSLNLSSLTHTGRGLSASCLNFPFLCARSISIVWVQLQIVCKQVTHLTLGVSHVSAPWSDAIISITILLRLLDSPWNPVYQGNQTFRGQPWMSRQGCKL